MNAKDLRDIAAELRIITEREIDDAEIRKGLRKTATDKGIDWSQLKALVKAQAQDARDDGKRVGKLVERADFALAYAEMLNMNANDESRSSSAGNPNDPVVTVSHALHQRNIERARLLRKPKCGSWTAMRRHSLIWGLAHKVITLREIRERHNWMKDSILLQWAMEARALLVVDMIGRRAA